jgi:hypothetical protein
LLKQPARRQLQLGVATAVVAFLLGAAYWYGRDLQHDRKGPLDLQFYLVMLAGTIILPILGWMSSGVRFGFVLVFCMLCAGSAAVLVSQVDDTPLSSVWMLMASFIAFYQTLIYALGGYFAHGAKSKRAFTWDVHNQSMSQET